MKAFLGMLLALVAVVPAHTSPGVADPVYGATISKGVAEAEMRYGRLTGGDADGADGLILEAAYAVTPRLAVALLFETSREPGRERTVDAIAAEAVRTLGRIDSLALDTAIYVEAKHGLHGGMDAIEIKGLFEHRRGPFDSRLNLIVEQPQRRVPAEFGYAASFDWAVIGDEIRLGAAAFGDLGTSARFGGRQEHFIGPVAKIGIEHVGAGELEIETGWLAAIGAARDVTRGQARLLLSYELRF